MARIYQEYILSIDIIFIDHTLHYI
jgi:hypothetical protein